MDAIPSNLIDKISLIHGSGGRAWVNSIQEKIGQCEAKWSLEVFTPFEDLSYNYVAPGRTSDGNDVVLKLGIPNGEISKELEALQLFSGAGAVEVLEHELDIGAILLQRLSPGKPLSTVADDEQATSIASEVMRQLRREVPVNHNFNSISDLLEGFERLRNKFGGSTGPFRSDLVSKAESLASDLVSGAQKEVVLHGDLHQDNILFDTNRSWVAIDPKGLVGAAEYEIGAFLRNLYSVFNSSDRDLIKRCLHLFSKELQFDPQKVRDWALVHSVLSAWWCFEDELYVNRQAIRCAQILSEV